MQLLLRLLRRQATYDTSTAAGLNLMVGLWLTLSPWILGYDVERAFWVPVATGAAVWASAFLRLAGGATGPALHVTDLLIAAWLVIAAVTIADGARPFWNDMACAAALAALATVGLLVHARRSASRPAGRPAGTRRVGAGRRRFMAG